MQAVEKKAHHPPCPAERRRTLPAIDARERAAITIGGRAFVRKDCAGKAAKNKGGK